MAQGVKEIATQVWQPELDPQNPLKGERRKLTPQRDPLSSAHTHRIL